MGNKTAFGTAPKYGSPKSVWNSGFRQTTAETLPGAENRNTLEKQQPGNKAHGFNADAEIILYSRYER